MEASTFSTLNPRGPAAESSSFNANATLRDYPELLASQLAAAALALTGLDEDNTTSDSSSGFVATRLAEATMSFAGIDVNSTYDGFATPTVELALRLAGAVLLLLLSLVGGFANAAVLLVFVRRPALRNRSNRFVMNLLTINLVSCGLLLPLAATDLLLSNPILCAVGEAVTAGVCASSALGVLVVAADQYRAVLRPLQYHATRSASSRQYAAAFMVATWLGGILCSVLSLIDLSPENALWNTNNLMLLNINFRSYFSLFYILFIFFIPVSSLCWLYGNIYKEAHKNSKRARRNGSTHECTENNCVNIQPLLNVPSPPANRIVSSLKHRISNASLFKYREEARAARVSFLVIFMSIICWSPYCIILILRALFMCNVPQYVLTLSIALLACTSLVSPALFAYRSRRLQREVKKLILCKTKNYSLPSRNFLSRDKWRKRAALAAVAAATLVNTPDKSSAVITTVEKQIMDSVCVHLTTPADTSRSSFSSGTTQGTTDIE